jgi:uncharacterized RDD family membrane protein YckC
VPPPDPIRRVFGVIVPRAVDSIDMNEVVGEIDLDQVLERIDLNEVLARIDMDALLERIDLDAVLQRVDIESLMQRIDVTGIIQRVQISAIVTATAGGLGNRLLDLVRRTLAGIDIILTRVIDRVFRRHIDLPVSRERSLTGQLAGGATRLAGFTIDWFVGSLIFAGLVALVFFIASLFVGHHVEPTNNGLAEIIAFVCVGLLYQWVGLVVAGRTIGRAIVGLRVTAPDGSPIGMGAATRRVLVYPFSFILGLGLVGIVIGQRHRALHDVAAPTLVRYDWGDRPAEMPSPISAYLERHGVRVRARGPAGDAPDVLAPTDKASETPAAAESKANGATTPDSTR